MLSIVGLNSIPIIKPGDDLPSIIVSSALSENITIDDGDVIVVTSKIVARSEGRVTSLKDIKPSSFAKELADATDKDPRLVELILRESNEIVGVLENGTIIVETKHGFVCANAGIDRSNVPGWEEDYVVLLPEDPEKSAYKIRDRIRELTGKDVAVIIKDSQGRCIRLGSVGVAIGVSGILPLWNRIGDKDMFGREMHATVIAVADELASAANHLMGEVDEAVPVVIIKGARYPRGDGKISEMFIPKERDLARRECKVKYAGIKVTSELLQVDD